ncbi:nucleolar complex protein 2 [Hordeum vulgare]|nr:nucleolar complex protein 2 [Hordeum vulgare]
MELGMKVEEYARGKGHLRNVFVTNALLEMYAKCGSIQRAWQADNIFRALLEISDDDKGKLMNQRNGKKWQDIEPLIKSYLWNSLNLISQLTDNQILTYVLTRLRTSVVYFSAYPSTSRRLLKILVRLWALQGILKESHSLFAMFHGPIGTSLDRQPSADFARGHLHTFVTVLNSSESHFTAI